MAHATLHFSIGIATASAIALPGIVRTWRRKERRLSARLAAWLLLSFAMGTYAIVPSLLRRLGVPENICEGWWMNVFLFHPLITGLKPGAMTSGPLALGFCFGAQYLVLLAAIRRYSRRAAPPENRHDRRGVPESAPPRPESRPDAP